ncbi:uncharacterized protein [Diadema antillarum]|uniref:uncharacterized protein n=1 Tax=Diadema antillarum TaxID=105358 RepID=UPI003A837228
MTAMQRTYFIEVVSVADVGYYQCLGRGILNDTAATASAAVAITDVIHVAVSNLVFNYQVGRPQELSDPSSETYRNQSEIIRDFLVTNLVLADEFEDMSTFVVVSRLRPGSVVADVVIYVSSDGRSATELQQQISDALTVIARSSDGLLNISRVTVSSPC